MPRAAAAPYFQTPSCVLLKSRVLRCVALRVRLSELCARVLLPLWERDFYENGGPPCKTFHVLLLLEARARAPKRRVVDDTEETPAPATPSKLSRRNA